MIGRARDAWGDPVVVSVARSRRDNNASWCEVVGRSHGLSQERAKPTPFGIGWSIVRRQSELLAYRGFIEDLGRARGRWRGRSGGERSLVGLRARVGVQAGHQCRFRAGRRASGLDPGFLNQLAPLSAAASIRPLTRARCRSNVRRWTRCSWSPSPGDHVGPRRRYVTGRARLPVGPPAALGTPLRAGIIAGGGVRAPGGLPRLQRRSGAYIPVRRALPTRDFAPVPSSAVRSRAGVLAPTLALTLDPPVVTARCAQAVTPEVGLGRSRPTR